jgi:hypothetical protein
MIGIIGIPISPVANPPHRRRPQCFNQLQDYLGTLLWLKDWGIQHNGQNAFVNIVFHNHSKLQPFLFLDKYISIVNMITLSNTHPNSNGVHLCYLHRLTIWFNYIKIAQQIVYQSHLFLSKDWENYGFAFFDHYITVKYIYLKTIIRVKYVKYTFLMSSKCIEFDEII